MKRFFRSLLRVLCALLWVLSSLAFLGAMAGTFYGASANDAGALVWCVLPFVGSALALALAAFRASDAAEMMRANS